MFNNGQSDHKPISGFIVTVHTIFVDGQEIYKGEDWHKAQALFIRHVQSLEIMHIRHEVNKRVAHYGGAPGTTDWGDPLRT
jgi:hypothetical protein